MTQNERWSQSILSKLDPKFRHRWIVYTETLKSLISRKTVWVDCGAGKNGTVKALGNLAKKATGVDVIEGDKYDENYVQADIRNLPFEDNSVDLLTLRFVVEHFEKTDAYFKEINRVLKSGGKSVVLTTNVISPLIFLPKLLMPYPLRHWVLTRLFKVEDEDIFPTYHAFNTERALSEPILGLRLVDISYISDLNYTRKWVFLVLLSFHLITRLPGLSRFRTNILAVLEKQ
ncbi:MAG: class I SAM-dependent methyltransferase [Calditrichota bacterium]